MVYLFGSPAIHAVHQMSDIAAKIQVNVMKRMWMVLLVGILVLFQYSYTDAKSIFPSDWDIVDQGDQERPSSWQYDRGIWTQTSNIYGGQQGASLPAKPGTFMVARDSGFSDGSIFMSLASDDDDGIGVMLRYRDTSNYYRFSMDKQRSYRRLVKVIDGIVTVLAEDAFVYEQERWYDLEIRAQGSVIEVLFDGEMIFNVKDPDVQSGKVALYCWGNTKCQFRDIRIDPVAKAITDEAHSDQDRGGTYQGGIPPSGTETIVAESGPISAPQAELDEPAYIIGPGDVLEISVWRDDALTKQLVVLPDGRISFPLIGEVMASGQTLSQLKTEMEERLEDFVPNPELHVAIEGISSMVIYMIGKVKSPGRYPIGQDIDVLEALAMAGGLTPFANKKEIRIFRQDGEQTKIFYFNYNDVAKGKNLEQNIELKRGDVIVVP